MKCVGMWACGSGMYVIITGVKWGRVRKGEMSKNNFDIFLPTTQPLVIHQAERKKRRNEALCHPCSWRLLCGGQLPSHCLCGRIRPLLCLACHWKQWPACWQCDGHLRFCQQHCSGSRGKMKKPPTIFFPDQLQQQTQRVDHWLRSSRNWW